MKLGNKISFGFNAVQAGQKNATVNAEPQLVAASTAGKFTITAPVSKALGIAVGENLMFLNNIANVEAAIQTNNEVIVAWANENGVDLTTREGQDAALKEFGMWLIAKGIGLYTKTGEQVMGSERYTKEDKQKFIDANAEGILAANRDALIERVGNPDASDEELIAAITPDDIESPKYHVHSGSKTSNTGSATGVGVQLNFTDTSIWNTLKADLGEDKTKKNRVFSVDLNEPVETTFFNGKEEVAIIAYPIEYAEDKEVIAREKAAE